MRRVRLESRKLKIPYELGTLNDGATKSAVQALPASPKSCQLKVRCPSP